MKPMLMFVVVGLILAVIQFDMLDRYKGWAMEEIAQEEARLQVIEREAMRRAIQSGMIERE